MGLNSSLSSLSQRRSVKIQGGIIGIAPGNRLLVTDQGLEGFPDLKVDPGLKEILLVGLPVVIQHLSIG